MLRRGIAAAVVMVAGLAGLGATAVAAPGVTARPAFELPFPCGERWKGLTYPGHGHGDYPMDLNKGAGWDDYGEPVVAAAAGQVSVREEADKDHVVVVDHGGGWTSEYRHMATRPVTSGYVERGTRIGTVGNESAGNPEMSPHLHHEQRLNGVAQPIHFHGEPAPYVQYPNSHPFTSYNCGGGPSLPADMSGVAAVSRRAGTLDVFAKDGDGSFLHKHWDGDSWSGWADLGGRFLSNPSAVNWGDDRIDVFGVGLDGELWQRTWTVSNGGWYGWVDTGGGRIQWTPAAASRGFGGIDVFAVNTAEQVVHRSFTVATGWSAWQNLGGTASAPPAAVAMSADRLNLLVRDGDGTLATRMWTRDNDGWYAWIDRGERIYGAPAVSHRSTNVMDVFVRDDADKSLLHAASSNGGQTLSAFVDLGGVLTSPLAAVSWSAGRIDVFGRVTNGHLYQRIWTTNNDNGWYGWVDIGTVG